MAVTGTHLLLYTPEAEALRAVLRDVLGWSSYDAGEGWPIFDLPPGELGVHPSEPGDSHHELALTCDDIGGTVAELRTRGIEFREEPRDLGWGVGTTMLLPGGVEVLLYEPRHPQPA
jgi:hypothetical protein